MICLSSKSSSTSPESTPQNYFDHAFQTYMSVLRHTDELKRASFPSSPLGFQCSFSHKFPRPFQVPMLLSAGSWLHKWLKCPSTDKVQLLCISCIIVIYKLLQLLPTYGPSKRFQEPPYVHMVYCCQCTWKWPANLIHTYPSLPPCRAYVHMHIHLLSTLNSSSRKILIGHNIDTLQRLHNIRI